MMKIVLVFVVLWKVCGTEYTICPTEYTIVSPEVSVEWRSTTPDTHEFSRPMCLDESKLPQNRFCNATSRKWMPSKAPNCNHIQEDYETMSKCPPEFYELKSDLVDDIPSCVRLSDATKWNNECVRHGSGKTIFDLTSTSKTALLDYLRTKRVTQMWLPANRSSLYEPVIWRLPVIWGDYVEMDRFNYHISNPIIDSGNCLSVQIAGDRLIGLFEKCSKKLPMLCVYQEKPLLSLGCDKNQFTTRYSHYQNICFTINNLRIPINDSARVHTKCEQNVLFHATSPEKNYIYQSLAENVGAFEGCAISVIPEQNDGRFSWGMWNRNLKKIEFIGWNMFLEEGNFTTNNIDGKWNLAYQVTCVACEQQVHLLKPEISLKFIQELGKLFMIVVNRKFLWHEDNNDNADKYGYENDEDEVDDKYNNDDDDEADDDDNDYDDGGGDNLGIYCFTYGGKDILKKIEIGKRIWSANIVPNFNTLNFIKKDVYLLEIENDGVYWCEGHAIPDFEVVQSKQVLAFTKSKGTTFATLMNYPCQFCSGQTNNQTFLREISSHFTTLVQSVPLPHGQIITSVRLIKIEWAKRSAIQLLFHIKIAVSDDFEDDGSEEDEPDEVGVPEEILEIYFLRKKMLSILNGISMKSKFQFVSMNHTQFCLPENLVNEDMNWISARINEKSVPKELCLQSNGIPFTRKCLGNFVYGGVWEQIQSISCDQGQVSSITQQLYQLGGQKNFTEMESMRAIGNLAKIAEYNRMELIAADLFYMGRVLTTLACSDNNETETYQTKKTKSLTNILSNVMLVNSTIIRKSQKLNTTNLILDAYNNIINKISLNNHSLVGGDGTEVVIMPKLIVFVADPLVKNISGVALYRKPLRLKTGDFNDYYIKPLYSNHQFTESIDKEPFSSGSTEVSDELEVASFVPEKLIKSLQKTNRTSTIPGHANITTVRPPLRIVITLHYDDVLFQENVNVTTEKSGSIIIGVSIPGYDTNLRGFIPIYFNFENSTLQNVSEPRNGTIDEALCGYWDFSPVNPDVNSEWAKDGCKFGGLINVPNPVKICYCTHLTHFALLVQGYFVNDYDVDNNYVLVEQMIHNEVLDVITLTGCSLSLVGIFGIYVTALMFRSWRDKPHAKVLLQLSTAIALQMILMCLVSSEMVNIRIFTDSKFNECIIFGASLQYSVLVVFSWMLITAYLQFVRYVRVLGNQRPARFFLKSFVIGWCVPLIPVILIVVIDPDSYIPPGVNEVSKVCYPSGYALYFGVLLPIALIVIANLIIFILVIFSISRGYDGKSRPIEREHTLSQLRLSIFLFFLLGLSWIFGLASASKMGITFSYLFCMTATIQGFVLFVYFIIMDPNTRKLWMNCFVGWGFCNHSNHNKITK